MLCMDINAIHVQYSRTCAVPACVYNTGTTSLNSDDDVYDDDDDNNEEEEEDDDDNDNNEEEEKEEDDDDDDGNGHIRMLMYLLIYFM